MKRKRFSVEQIVAVLKQAELGVAVADIIRQVGISEQTFYRWKKQYAGMQSDQVRELKQLQDENARLKKLVAELSLDKAILQDVAAKNLRFQPQCPPAFPLRGHRRRVRARCGGWRHLPCGGRARCECYRPGAGAGASALAARRCAPRPAAGG